MDSTDPEILAFQASNLSPFAKSLLHPDNHHAVSWAQAHQKSAARPSPADEARTMINSAR